MMCYTCLSFPHVPGCRQSDPAGWLRSRLNRSEVLRVASACQDLAMRQGRMGETGPLSPFRRAVGYRGDYICFDNMLAEILIPSEPLMGESFPSLLREVCDELDDLNTFVAHSEVEHVRTMSSLLFAQLAQILLELVE